VSTLGGPRRSNATLRERAAGVLLHPTSLPGPLGAGDLGEGARAFVDFLAEAGVRWWQMLPLGPVGPGNSPYSSTSVFAGSPWLVDVGRLVDDGLVEKDHAALAPMPAATHADFAENERRRDALLRAAFAKAEAQGYERAARDAFEHRSQAWLRDFALYAALKRARGGVAFGDWPDALRLRDRAALRKAEDELASEVRYFEFVQFLFDRDLEALGHYAASKGVALMGDIPIFVAHDSADVWAHRELFQMDEAGHLRAVAGVPPDAFSDDGQLWGNPLYDWDVLKRSDYGFWVARLALLMSRFDAVRFDHFIGFQRYWAIPTTAKTAKAGTYRPGPGRDLFDAFRRSLGPLELVAEDLGVLTDEVKALRDSLDLPGMNVLEFSFSPDPSAESSRPHHYKKRSVVYTGTHDNDTIAGWLSGPPGDASEATRTHYANERKVALEYLGLDPARSPAELAWGFVRAAFMSQADTAIVPAQDLLGLGREARMNRPGVGEGNWSFRLLPGQLDRALGERVAHFGSLYGRRAKTR
jgi:4-alpha-glucanotransferase